MSDIGKEKEGWFESSYCFLASVCTTSLVGLLAGMDLGITINLATGQDPVAQLPAIGLFLFAFIWLVKLNNTRQTIDFDHGLQAGRPVSRHDRWRAAVDFGNKKRLRNFFLAFFLSVAFLSAGVWKIYAANREQVNAGMRINAMADRIRKLEIDSAYTHRMVDSIRAHPVDTANRRPLVSRMLVRKQRRS